MLRAGLLAFFASIALSALVFFADDDRTLDKVIDGISLTCSDEHMWLIPFTPGGEGTSPFAL